MMVSDESEEIWSGGGLTIEYLELQARWKISFDGLLRYYNTLSFHTQKAKAFWTLPENLINQFEPNATW